jgi:hypothetical protein
MNTVDNIVIEEIAHHRNGVCGAPFSVVKFVCPENGAMLAVVFDLSDGDGYSWDGRVAVFKRDLLADDVIAFGENSWRGDHYESALRKAIEAFEDAL